MSKYLMNKFIHHVNMNESAEKEYKSDPRAFVEMWEKGEEFHGSRLVARETPRGAGEGL